ncbi:MAG: telomere binding protein [Cirrosporium novae-zelandiae]|nr:MAG: telomere binding protein [Cirrosporium novae-zelandiae]
MDELLRPVKTTRVVQLSNNDEPLLRTHEPTQKPDTKEYTLNTPHDALEILKSNPSVDLLVKVAEFIAPKKSLGSSFSIKSPGPKATEVLNVLVQKTILDFWPLESPSTDIQDRPKSTKDGDRYQPREKAAIIRCLRSTAGVGALVARIRYLIDAHNAVDGKKGPSNDVENVKIYLDVLMAILEPISFLFTLHSDLCTFMTRPLQRSIVWKELASLVAGGRVLGVAAEAERTISTASKDIQSTLWIGDGILYAEWLGKNISAMALRNSSDEKDTWTAIAQIFARSMSLGYTDQIIESIYSQLLFGPHQDCETLKKLQASMQVHDRRTLLLSTLRIASKKYLTVQQKGQEEEDDNRRKMIGGIAGLLISIIKNDPALGENLTEWLTSSSGGSVGQDIRIRRAVITALAHENSSNVGVILEKSLRLFSDKLYIKHAATLQQEANAQIILLTAGYIHKNTPGLLNPILQLSPYLNGITNHLSVSSPRVRLLGIVIGMALSDLIHEKPEDKLKFDLDELEDVDARWYLGLTKVSDTVESLGILKPGVVETSVPKKKSTVPKRKDLGQTTPISSKIVEIGSSSEEDDDDLPTYEKPDEDEEDSEEDPTLVQRQKPQAPVYIRDLLAGLRDADNYDRHTLAFKTAPSLIRRKAKFGSEVTDHIVELASQFINLQDKYGLENFEDIRLQAMMAVLIADPVKMGPWFSVVFFEGEYSISQRISILTTLGMVARELAGFENDTSSNGAASLQDNFPSKKLPEKLRRFYEPASSPIDTLSKLLERTMIQPMALEAADKVTGPDILKVRTFSSRMDVEKRRKKPVANELSKIAADAFFYPLIGRWKVQLQASGRDSIYFSPFILTSFIKTLALILHASGPSTPSLPGLTAEFWDLLLSLRKSALDEITVVEALLFAFLTLLEVNEDKRSIAQDHAQQFLETRGWVEQIFELASGEDEESKRVKMLAASVLSSAQEVVEKHQRLLLGNLLDF